MHFLQQHDGNIKVHAHTLFVTPDTPLAATVIDILSIYWICA